MATKMKLNDGLRGIFLTGLVFLITGCAGVLPVPGGDDTTNESFFQSKEEMLGRVSIIHAGMSEDRVFAALGYDKDRLVRLKRDQIVTVLYGSSFIDFGDETHGASGASFLQSFYGYRLDYKDVEREHGFSSPVRMKTDEGGFEYAVSFVFRDGILYADPIVTGGVVNRSSSSTIFDFLNPGIIIRGAGG